MTTTHRIWSDSELDELCELLLVSIFVILLQQPHVVGNVQTKDVLTMCLSIEFLAFIVVTWEAFGATRRKNKILLLCGLLIIQTIFFNIYYTHTRPQIKSVIIHTRFRVVHDVTSSLVCVLTLQMNIRTTQRYNRLHKCEVLDMLEKKSIPVAL